jgi:hypothetical protein
MVVAKPASREFAARSQLIGFCRAGSQQAVEKQPASSRQGCLDGKAIAQAVDFPGASTGMHRTRDSKIGQDGRFSTTC